MPFGYQIVVRAREERVLAPDRVARQAFAAAVRRVGRPRGLYAYGLADTHGHCALACERADAGRFAHDIRLSLRSVLGFEIDEASILPIRDIWHAESVLHYVHRQDVRHGVGLDPFAEATSIHDLLGLRPVGGWLGTRLRSTLPRVRTIRLPERWGLREVPETFDLQLLAEAGAAAVGRGELTGRERAVVLARHACVHAADAVPARVLADALGVTERCVRALRESPADARLVAAVRRQMGLRQAVAAAQASAPQLRDQVGDGPHAGAWAP